MTWTEIILYAAVPISTLAGAYYGARIGGKFTLAALEEAHKRTILLQKENQELMVKRLLQAIYDEIETMWEMYKEKLGFQVDALKDGEPFNYYVPVMQDYFTVYNGNAILIGHIPDADLRKAIVTTYTKARGLIDSFRLNNDFVQKNEYWFQLHQQTQNPVHQQHFTTAYQILVDYARKIKKSHDDLKLSVTDLLRRLQKEGVLYVARK